MVFMPRLPPVRYLATALLATLVAGCATDTSRWFDYDESRDRLVLVVGAFSSIRWLDEVPPCEQAMPASSSETELIVDCVNVPPAIVTLNVQEAIYGDPPGQRLHVVHYASPYAHRKAPGDGKPMLVLMHTDGEHYHTSSLQLLARTTQGDWALPVERKEILDILPCGAEPLVKPLRFVHPQPVTHGIPLSDIKKLIAEKARPTPKEYECPYYDLPDSHFIIEGLRNIDFD
jgi:hypothetical protein